MSGFKVRDAIWFADGLSPVEKFTLLALAEHMGRSDSAYPSIARLKTMTGYSERAIQKALRRLSEIGWVTIIPGGGRGHTNRYRINQKGERAAGFDEEKGEPQTVNEVQNPEPDAPISGERVNHIRKRVNVVHPNPKEPQVGGGGHACAREAEPEGLPDRLRRAAGVDAVEDPRRAASLSMGWADHRCVAAANPWRSLGLSDEDIVAEVQAVAGRPGYEVPSTPSYFDKPMQRLAGAASRTLTPIEGGRSPPAETDDRYATAHRVLEARRRKYANDP